MSALDHIVSHHLRRIPTLGVWAVGDTMRDGRWGYYYSLLLLRVALSVLQRGTIHPDEYFQSQEVMARHSMPVGDALQQQLFIPWEYAPSFPNRSVLFPGLVAGLPYVVFRAFGVELTGLWLLLIPRVILVSLSCCFDYVLFRVVKQLELGDPLHVLLVFASSWPTLVFLPRPFSNSFEALVLILCIAVAFLTCPHRWVVWRQIHLQTWLLGSLLAIGFFTRFTFLAFFFPFGVYLVGTQDRILCESLTKKESYPSTCSRMQRLLLICFQGFVAFVVHAALISGLDTWYFAAVSNGSFLDRLVVAPLNNLVYNMQYENLKLHGVHPRLTHAAVFMPMLFGPTYFRFLFRGFRASAERATAIHWLLVGAVLLPLGVLSVAPHQEARFLLPILGPLHLAVSRSPSRPRLFWFVWLLFNGILTLFFGILHQGGLVPMLLALSSRNGTIPSLSACRFIDSFDGVGRNTSVLFYKTYMPPRFLIKGAMIDQHFSLVDLGGSGDFTTQLSRSLTEHETVYLVAPASVRVDSLVGEIAAKYHQVGSCFPHVTTEDFSWERPLTLDIYQIR